MKAPAFAPDALGRLVVPPADRAIEELQRSARNAYELRHFSRALQLYEQLSACGHARAAEIAGQMHLFGESLYGAAVQRDPMRAAELLARAAQAGSPIAQHLLRQIDRSA